MVGYVGVMGDQEGIDLLLEAAREMVFDHGRDVQFVLVGGGPALEDLKALAAETLGSGRSRDLYGPGARCGPVRGALFQRRCLREPRSGEPDERQVDHEQGYGIYGFFGKPQVQFEVTEGRFSAQDASLYAEPNNTSDMAAKVMELLDDPETPRRRWALTAAPASRRN